MLGLQQVEIIQQDLNSLDSRLRTLSSDADIAAFRDKLVAGVQQLDRTLTRMWALKNVSEMAD